MIKVTKRDDTSYTGVKSRKVNKQETQIIASSALELEDEFQRYYEVYNGDTAPLLTPPFNPKVLQQLPTENNSLNQLISAMEVNIDGTGIAIEPKSDIEPSDDVVRGIEDFFAEVYPGESFITARRLTRRDMEATGNGYMEVIRSFDGQITFIRHVESTNIRLVLLDDPVAVTKTVSRFGQEVKLTMSDRERRYAQKVGDRIVYFKEFGASRDLDKNTGEWAEQGETIPVDVRATELLHFGVIKDATSPYFLPRWINQLPSVLGSRKAEEFNLEFFNSGGVPPFLIFLAGGALTPEIRRQVQSYITGKGASKHRGGIVEVSPISASLDGGANKIDVQVERFGSEQQDDSMFENYDTQCAKRVAGAFRLPPIFRGMAEDYSFATAFASYTVAEAQVFQPEREEFDEVINNTIMKEIAPDYIIRSLPLNVNDATVKMTGITLAAQQGALSGEELIDAINEVVDLGLQVSETQVELPNTAGRVDILDEGTGQNPPATPAVPVQRTEQVKKFASYQVLVLANEWARKSEAGTVTPDLKAVVDNLSGDERDMFNSYLALKVFDRNIDHDVEGCIELASAATDILACGCGENHGSS